MGFRKELVYRPKRFEEHVRVRPRVGGDLLVEESLDQIGVDVPGEHLLVLDIDHRRLHISRDDGVRVVEEMCIVRCAVGIRDDRRDRTPSPSCPSCPLLVVRDVGRYVLLLKYKKQLFENSVNF